MVVSVFGGMNKQDDIRAKQTNQGINSPGRVPVLNERDIKAGASF